MSNYQWLSIRHCRFNPSFRWDIFSKKFHLTFRFFVALCPWPISICMCMAIAIAICILLAMYPYLYILYYVTFHINCSKGRLKNKHRLVYYYNLTNLSWSRDIPVYLPMWLRKNNGHWPLETVWTQWIFKLHFCSLRYTDIQVQCINRINCPGSFLQWNTI